MSLPPHYAPCLPKQKLMTVFEYVLNEMDDVDERDELMIRLRDEVERNESYWFMKDMTLHDLSDMGEYKFVDDHGKNDYERLLLFVIGQRYLSAYFRVFDPYRYICKDGCTNHIVHDNQ